MPYDIIVPLVVGLLVWRHVASSTRSTRSKVIVVVVASGAFLAGMLLPALGLAPFVAMAAVGVYLAIDQHIRSTE
jgi:hydrogenase/urease accessory protein HupE